MTPPIFCINLESSTDRKKFIQSQWIDRHNLDITFWKATQKTDVSLQFIEKKSTYMKRDFLIGELALIDSNIKLLKYILEKNIDEVIIMEDDIFPNPVFELIENMNLSNIMYEYIQKCKEEFENLSILLMHKPLAKNSFEIAQEYKFCYRPKTLPWGTNMNYYTLRGIELMYDSIKKYDCVLDHWHRMPNLKNQIGLTKNSFCFHCDTNMPQIRSDIR